MRIRLLTGVGVLCLCGLSFAQTTAPLHADRVIVLKKERTLQLLSQGKVVKTYKVALGGDPVGPKTRQGDHKTPEGLYVLDSRNVHSQFYKSLHISYPSARDRLAARAEGRFAGGRRVRAWTAKGLRLGGRVSPPEGLDRRMHSGHERRDQRDLGGGGGRNSDRDPSVRAHLTKIREFLFTAIFEAAR